MTSAPEWRKAWKLDDPAWVKERQRDWKRIKQNPLIKEWFKGDDLKALKNFFLTGSCYDPEPPENEWPLWRYDPDKTPLYPVEAEVLMECWLTADQSEGNWRHIKEKYHEQLIGSSRARFREWMRTDFPEEGCLFDGLEERLYFQFGPTRCREEDYPHFSREALIRRAWSVYNDWKPLITKFFAQENPPACNIAPVVIPEWCDSLPLTYEALAAYQDEREKLLVASVTTIVQAAHATLTNSSLRDQRQLTAAHKLMVHLREPPLPQDLETALAPYLNTAPQQLP